MSAQATVAIIQLINTLLQYAQAVGLTMPELLADKKRAEDEGRTWNHLDVERLVAKSRSDVDTLKAKLEAEVPNG